MPTPSIKGTALASVVEDVRGLLSSGRLEQSELERLLPETDRQLLDEKILPGHWYDIESYRRLSELLLELAGHGNPLYLVARGRRAAERLFDSGLYAQMRTGMERASKARQTGAGWAERDGHLMATLAGAIFNFTRWTFRIDPDKEGLYHVDVEEAEGLPEVARFAAQGFIEYTASRLAENAASVTSRREAEDRVSFTIHSVLGSPS